jgi:rSAM/selenodomain-associated transferase 1
MKSNAPRPEAVRIAVFAKAPVPGAVKTRLAGVLDAAAAAQLHGRLVRHALATARAAQAGAVELWCAPDADHPFFASCAREFDVALECQQGDDLGERMAHAFNRTLASGAALVIIGGDCPELTGADLAAAVAALRGHDAVVAPAEDGGYVLIGLSTPAPSLFAGVSWSTAAVMEQTRERLAAAGLRWTELRTFHDLDRPEDYRRLLGRFPWDPQPPGAAP